MDEPISQIRKLQRVGLHQPSLGDSVFDSHHYLIWKSNTHWLKPNFSCLQIHCAHSALVETCACPLVPVEASEIFKEYGLATLDRRGKQNSLPQFCVSGNSMVLVLKWPSPQSLGRSIGQEGCPWPHKLPTEFRKECWTWRLSMTSRITISGHDLPTFWESYSSTSEPLPQLCFIYWSLLWLVWISMFGDSLAFPIQGQDLFICVDEF